MIRTNLLRALLGSSVLLALPSPAALYTVGPGGSHASIQAAVSAAQGGAGDDEIRIRSGTYAEQVSIALGTDKTLQISGGWNAGFDSRVNDPAATVVDGTASGIPLSALVLDGDLQVSHLTLRNGAASFGAGVNFEVRDTGSVALSDCVVRDNTASAGPSAAGAGILARASEAGSISIARCHVHLNTASSVNGSAVGAGVELRSAGSASVSLLHNLIDDNTLVSDTGVASGAGLYANCSGSSNVDVAGNRIERNGVASGATAAEGYAAFFLAGVAGTGDCLMHVRGNVITHNALQAAGNGFDFQVQVYAVGNSQVVFGDNLVAAGAGGDGGLWATAFNTAVLALVNLSLVDNPGEGLRLQRTGAAELGLFNTLAFGNGSDALPAGASAAGSNLFGTDPLFAGPSGYRLSAASPARDAGAASPPGGLGSVDADGGARVVGTAVDIGAFEYGSMQLFSDGFED